VIVALVLTIIVATIIGLIWLDDKFLGQTVKDIFPIVAGVVGLILVGRLAWMLGEPVVMYFCDEETGEEGNNE
jgi:hypothetical protein